MVKSRAIQHVNKQTCDQVTVILHSPYIINYDSCAMLRINKPSTQAASGQATGHLFHRFTLLHFG